MAFKGTVKKVAPPASPEALYRDLPRRSDAVPGLWAHQADLLRLYAGDHTRTPDLALELPTGTGKTLTGLIIAEWVRQTRQSRTAYACPTQQLALQVAKVAAREGVPTATLIGKAREWPREDRTRYEAVEAVAVTTYNTIFNSSPKLADAGLILFDDAHAGEQYVGEQYALLIKRWEDVGAYSAVLDAIAPAIDGIPLQRLRDVVPDAGVYRQVRLVVPLRNKGMVSALDQVLSSLPKPYSYRLSMIRDALASCLVYVSYGMIMIRPVVPPTHKNKTFDHATQRIYLSATLGAGGELERAFGRSNITRIALPSTAPTPRSGRRYFIFPELISGMDSGALAQTIVAMAGKALVLAPDNETANTRARAVAQAGWPVLTMDDVAEGMEPFASLRNAVCGLAARYDGLDLPGDDCRVVILEGKPNADNLQERFLSNNVRAGGALAERVRTRVVQGAGRCTRGPNDWAIVVILGGELTDYLVSPEMRQSLGTELQAEIDFGVQNSRGTTAAEALANVNVFLAQGEEWRYGAEPILTDLRNAAEVLPPEGTLALGEAVEHEVEACGLAAAARWREASAQAQEAASKLGRGGDSLRGYRSYWLYLAGIWADQAGEDPSTAGLRHNARALVSQAEAAAKPGTWIRELPPLPNMERETLSPSDASAVAVAASRLRSTTSAKIDILGREMLTGLEQRTPRIYEPALTQLGLLLGATAAKPLGTGRSDSTWCWDNELWIALDAKSDHEPRGLVPHKDVRQAGDQLRLLASDRGVPTPPADSVTVIISPKPAIDPTAAASAEDHVYWVTPQTISNLAEAALAAWKLLLGSRAGVSDGQLRELAADCFKQHGLLPEQVRERLTARPVSSRWRT